MPPSAALSDGVKRPRVNWCAARASPNPNLNRLVSTLSPRLFPPQRAPSTSELCDLREDWCARQHHDNAQSAAMAPVP